MYNICMTCDAIIYENTPAAAVALLPVFFSKIHRKKNTVFTDLQNSVVANGLGIYTQKSHATDSTKVDYFLLVAWFASSHVRPSSACQ